MRNFFVLPFIAVLLSLVACDSKKDEKKPEDKKTEQKAPEQEEENTQFGDMPFDEFFGKFKTDEAFQVSRIYFPLVNKYDDFDSETGEVTTIQETMQKSDWKFFNFSNNGVAESVNFNIVREGFNTTVEMRGTDNGVSVNYIFEDMDGKWFLVSVEDHSM